MESAEHRSVYESFAHTEYGKKLENSIRYEKYNLGALSNEDWCELLGRDANNLYHMQETYELAERFIDSQNNSDKAPIDSTSASLVLLASAIHDQAEVFVGDTSYGDKTSQDEMCERETFERNLTVMNPGMNALTSNIARSAIRGVIFDPSTSEGELFNAIERTGYLTTALRVATKRHAVVDPQTADGIDWLITDVLLNQMPTLIGYARTYNLPHELLTQNAELVSTLFAAAPDHIFNHYEENCHKKQTDFIKAREKWTTFCSSHSI